MEIDEKGLISIWCNERQQRVLFGVCRKDESGNCDCTAFRMENGEYSPKHGKESKMPMPTTNANMGISQELFLSEIRKLSEKVGNQIKDLKDLLVIVDERLVKLSTATITTNTMNVPISPSKAISGNSNADINKALEKAEIDLNKIKIDLFLEAFRSKFSSQIPFPTKEDANTAITQIYLKGQKGPGSNEFWSNRQNQVIRGILQNAFTSTANANTVVKNKAYFLKAFPKMEAGKLELTLQTIQKYIEKKELVDGLFDKTAINSIGEYLGIDLWKIYPEKEVLEFFRYLVSYVRK